MKPRRLRTASPAALAMPVQAKIDRFCCAYHGSGLSHIATAVSTPMVARPTRQVVGRSVWAPTL